MEDVIIGRERYIKESDTPKNIESSDLCGSMVGQHAIVRSYSEGVNFGEIVAADGTGIILKNCRRLRRHFPLNKTLSWYEGVALSGLGSQSQISCAVPLKVVIEKYSITVVSDVAKKSIIEFPTHEQN